MDECLSATSSMNNEDKIRSRNRGKDRMKPKNARIAIAGVAILGMAMFFIPSNADAHATSIGFENGGGPGIVNIWLGTYEHGGHHLEGSMNLVGVNGNLYPNTTIPFTLLTGTGFGFKPAGLIDGTTNFFAPCSPTGGSAPLCRPSLFRWCKPLAGCRIRRFGCRRLPVHVDAYRKSVTGMVASQH